MDQMLIKYDELCREVYGDPRLPPGTRELALAMGWVMFRRPQAAAGKPFWREVRLLLGNERFGGPRVWELLAADAPRYERPYADRSTATCEGPRLRPYRSRNIRPRQFPPPTIYVPEGGVKPPYDQTEGGRVCGAHATIHVTEWDMVTGQVTAEHSFCRRHEQRAREVGEQLAARGERPPPIPNVGGLLPCFFKADWERLYTRANEKALHGRRWEPPYHGICADEWPTPGRGPVPRRPRLSVVPAL